MKILLATDGSEHSEGAAKFLARFDISALHRITVLHVVPGVPFPDSRDHYHAALSQIGEEIAPAIVDAATRHLKDLGADIVKVIKTGHPAETILEVAEQTDSDVIVMGSRGMKPVGSLLFGSMTRAVAISSPRSVLVVKPPQGKDGGPLKVLFATDNSGCAREAGKLLVSLPFPANTSITAVYVAPTYMEVPDKFFIEMEDRIKKISEHMMEREMKHAVEVLEQAREALKAGFSNVEIMTKYGDPSEQILQAAKETGADIIALGSKGMRGVRGMLGSVARNVLGYVECSVLICKRQGKTI